MSLYNLNKLYRTALFGLVLCTLNISASYAQGLGNSPYSVLGVGEASSDAFSTNLGMGGAGVSAGNGIHINNLNPALWVRNRYTTFEFGAIVQYKQISSSSASQRDFGGNLAYLALSLPAKPRWKIGVSLKPYSFVDFQSRTSAKVPGTIYDTEYLYSGKGAINKVAITNAFQVGKYLSLGLETGYLFGNVRRASESQLVIGDGIDYLVSRNERTGYSDFSLRTGAALSIPLKKENKLYLNLGGAYTFGTDLNARQTTSFELTNNTFPVGIPDTLSNNAKGSVHLPSQFQIGASLEWPYKLTLAVDYSLQSWSDYRSFNNNNDNLTNAGRIHAGLEYIPSFSNSAPYFKTAEYRLGFSHGKMPYNPAGMDLKDTNFTFGTTFPINGGNSFTLSLVGGMRGVASTQSIRERYGRVVLGITLVDRHWFEQQRID